MTIREVGKYYRISAGGSILIYKNCSNRLKYKDIKRFGYTRFDGFARPFESGIRHPLWAWEMTIQGIGSMKEEINIKIVQNILKKSCNGSLYGYTILATSEIAVAKVVTQYDKKIDN